MATTEARLHNVIDSKDAYIARLEKMLLTCDCSRCAECGEVFGNEELADFNDGRYCDACLPGAKRDAEENDEPEEDTDKAYEYARDNGKI